MTLELSPRLILNRFLRQQMSHKVAYREWFDAANDRWKAMVRPRGEALVGFAQHFEAALRSAGAFDLQAKGSQASLRLKNAKGIELVGFTLWPLTLGYKPSDGSNDYLEQSLMFIRTGMEITPKKVVACEAPLCLGWTRHALERLCERGDITTESDLETVLQIETPIIADNVALAATHELMKAVGGDGTFGSTLWIPYRGRLADRHWPIHRRVQQKPEIGLDV